MPTHKLESNNRKLPQNAKLRDLATRSIGRLLWEYSLPAVTGMVVMALYNVIDRIFIGRGVGPEAIAGLTITFPVQNLAGALGVLIGGGAAARVSIMLGAKNFTGASQVLGNSLTLILINGAIYVTLFGVFLDPILVAFGASEETLPYAHDFLMWLLPGMLVINITFSFNNIMRASGYPTRAMVTMLIGAGSNLILAPIFIFALDMGIKGAAIATDIAMTISAVFVMAHFFDKKSTLRFTRGIYGLRWEIVWGIITIGAAPCLVNAAASLINAIVNNSLLPYGSSAIAAVGIFSTYTSLLCMIVVGLCQGMQPIIGYNYGAGHRDRSVKTLWLAIKVASVVTATGCVFGELCPRWIAMTFTVDQELIDVSAHALRMTLFMFWIVGFQIVATNFFMAIGKAGKSIFLSLSRQVIFLIPILLILPRHYGIDGVWWSFPASDVFATIVTAVLIFYELRQLRNHYHL